MIAPTLFVFTAFLGILWLYFFLREKATRHEMLLLGVVAAFFTPVFTTLAEQTLQGTLSILDFLIAFFFAGIAAVIFESIFGKHYRIRHHAHLPFRRPAEHWFAELLLSAIAWSWLSLALLFILKTTPLQSLIVSGLIIGSYIIARRRDLFWNALWSGFLMAGVFYLLYVLSFARNLKDLTSPYLLDIPGDAILFAGVVGFVLGPLYEFARNLRSKQS